MCRLPSSRGEAYQDGMRIFLAGASGVIGQRLIPRLGQFYGARHLQRAATTRGTSGSHRPSCRTNGGGAGPANGRRRHCRLSARPRSGPNIPAKVATISQRQNVHEGRHRPSQGWYTGSTPVRPANAFIGKLRLSERFCLSFFNRTTNEYIDSRHIFACEPAAPSYGQMDPYML